jgi:diguanylate cyclase (GGDEF)-like protein
MYASKKAGRNRSYWHDGREIHPVAEDSAAAHPAPAAALPRANPSSGAGSPCAVAPRSAQESPEALDYQYDRTAFLRHVRQRIAEWKRGGSAFCVLRIQVEQDEPVLDTPAREAGDQSLRLTVRILNAVVREMDLIGRYERGCFAVLLPCTTIEEGSIVAERVRQTIDRSDPFFDDHPMRFTLRVGLVEVAEGDDAVRLLQRAEVAMADQAGARTYGGDDRRNAPAQLPPQPQAADLPGVTFADGAGSSAGGEVHAG